MDNVLSISQFKLMNEDEMFAVDGGGVLGDALRGVAGCLLIAAGGVSVIVGVGVAIGTGGAATLPALKVAGAGVSAIVAGAKMLDSLY